MDERRSSEESESRRLEVLYRKATDPVLRTHLLMVWRMSLGEPVGEVARTVGYSRKWATEIAKRYESGGVEALGDRRHGNPVARERALLDESGEAELLVGAGGDKRILLVLDQAGWHTSGEVELPEGIHLAFLPSGSPELQPAERLWPLGNEAIANRLFEEISEVEEALLERCLQLLDQAGTIRDLTNYHCWPQTA